jgi:cytochrome b subunit of formate dehydrogenase
MLLTFERLIKISNTYTYQKYINTKHVKISLVIVWTLSAIVGSLPFFGWSSMNILHLCSFIRTMSDSYLVFILILHILPFLFTFFAYLRMVIVVRRHAYAIEQTWRGDETRRNCTTRAVVTTIVVVGVYFVCWAPMGTI